MIDTLQLFFHPSSHIRLVDTEKGASGIVGVDLPEHMPGKSLKSRSASSTFQRFSDVLDLFLRLSFILLLLSPAGDYMLQTTYYKSRDSDQGPLIIVLAQQNFTVLTAYTDAPQTVKAEELILP